MEKNHPNNTSGGYKEICPVNKYCYPDSDVVINKLNITRPEVLFDAEKELTLIRLRELQQNPIVGKFDFIHLKAIHKYIFQDLYDLAGEIRTVSISKRYQYENTTTFLTTITLNMALDDTFDDINFH